MEAPVKYKVSITYSAPKESMGEGFIIESAGQQLEGNIQDTGEPFRYQTYELGGIEFPERGIQKVLIHPANESQGDLMYFHSLQLIPEI